MESGSAGSSGDGHKFYESILVIISWSSDDDFFAFFYDLHDEVLVELERLADEISLAAGVSLPLKRAEPLVELWRYVEGQSDLPFIRSLGSFHPNHCLWAIRPIVS